MHHCNNATKRQCNNETILRSCKSQITFEKFTKKEIDDYVKIANVTSFAGGFAPNLKGGEIIKRKMKIKGSVSNVLGGLPLEILLPILKENGVKI